MVARQDDDSAGRLGDRTVQIFGERSHHHASQDERRIGQIGPACGLQAEGERRADRDADRNRTAYRPGDRDELLDDRRFPGSRDVIRRLDVHHDRADRQRNPPGGDHAAERFIDQHELVPRRIGVVQRNDLHPAAEFRLKGIDDVLVFPFDPDDPARGAGQLHAAREPLDDRLAVVENDLFVFMEKRFALGGVDHDGIGFTGELHVGRESGPPGSDDAGGGQIGGGNRHDVF